MELLLRLCVCVAARVLTPAQADVPGQVLLEREEGAAHQSEQEVALHQQPAVVGQDGVVGEHQRHLAGRLSPGERRRAGGGGTEISRLRFALFCVVSNETVPPSGRILHLQVQKKQG